MTNYSKILITIFSLLIFLINSNTLLALDHEIKEYTDISEYIDNYVSPIVPNSMISLLDSLEKDSIETNYFSMSFYVAFDVRALKPVFNHAEFGRILNFGNKLQANHPVWIDAENSIKEAISKWKFKAMNVPVWNNNGDSIPLRSYVVYLLITFKKSWGHFARDRFFELNIIKLNNSIITIKIPH